MGDEAFTAARAPAKKKKEESMTFETEINKAFLKGISYKYLQGTELRWASSKTSTVFKIFYVTDMSRIIVC